MAQSKAQKAAAAKAAAEATAKANAGPQIDMGLLKAIVEGTKSEAQCLYVPEAISKPLVDAGLAIINPTYKDANGNIATRATDAGIAKLEVPAAPVLGAIAPAPQATASAAVVGGFKLETGVAIPEAKRGFGIGHGGQGRKSIYPFAEMQVGHSFFVGPTEAMPEPAKTLGSTVSSATLRYSEPVFNADGTPKMVETMVAQRDAAGNVMKDVNGKRLQVKGHVQEKKQTRKFVIRAVEENSVKGARIFRTA